MVRGSSDENEAGRLRREVEQAFAQGLDADRTLSLLARLARSSAPGSEDWLFAHRHLAERGVDREPWRASLFARRVLSLDPGDNGAWAVLGLAQSLLGHFRFAVRAYRRALALAPDNPWYAHNLGHLLDCALDRPEEAVPLLAQATQAQPAEADIAASYAHALARCGRVAEARQVLRRVIRRGATADQMALWRWIEAGAPPRGVRRAQATQDAQDALNEPDVGGAPRAEPRRKVKRRRTREEREGHEGRTGLSGRGGVE